MQTEDILTIVTSACALTVSVYTFIRSTEILAYQGLDTSYFELLKLGMQKPRFLDPQLTNQYADNFSGDELAEYNIYASMVWNLCETIYDRRKMSSISSTWDCIIGVESKLHRTWFVNEQNKCRFKEKFLNYMKKRFDRENKPSPNAFQRLFKNFRRQ